MCFNRITYCLGDLVFHTLAQNSLKDKGVTKFLCLKAKDKRITKKKIYIFKESDLNGNYNNKKFICTIKVESSEDETCSSLASHAKLHESEQHFHF